MNNILLAGSILTVLGWVIGTLFGSKSAHENDADLIAHLMFYVGFGCVIVWGLATLIFGVGE